MTISDTDKIDFLWKKVIYGVTKTANSAIKSGANESIASPYAISSGNIWSHAELIPSIPPISATADVVPYLGSQRIRATSDNTATPYKTWFATSTYNTISTRLQTFIPPIYGAGYIAQVFIGDPNIGPAVRIFPDAENEEYVFDYSAGVLTFVNNIPASKAATIGSGSVTAQSNGIYIIAYRYVGPTGGSGGGGGIGDYVSKTGDTMSGPLIFSMTNEENGKTILFSANPTANSYAGIGTLNSGETRFFANSSSVISLGHMSNIDGTTYTPDLSIGPDGIVTIGNAADGVVSVEDGYRIVLGHISSSNNLTENLVIESNGVAYSNGYQMLTSGSNTGVLAGYSSSFNPLATGTYLSANIVVDNTGRIISASNGSGGGGGGSGSVTQVNLSGSAAISVTGTTITTSGTYALDLSNTGVMVGTYSKVSVDAKGRIIAGYPLLASDVNTALGYTAGTVTSVTATGSSDITVSGSSNITSSGTFALSLANTTVIPQVYTNPTITVDSKGRITQASNGAVLGTVESVTIANGSTSLSISGSPITTSGTITIDMTNTGVLAGTYSKVIVDVKGRVTGNGSLNSTDITTALGFNPLQHNETITLSGDISGSGASSISATLSTTGVQAGTYTLSTITVDSKGRITNAVSGSASGTGTVTSVNANSTTLSISGGPVTSSGTLSINLSPVGTSGTYAKVITDSYGRVTGSSALSSTDITTALGFTPSQGTVTSVNANSTTLSISGGPVTSSGTLSVNLSTVGTAGTYIKVITDSYGRVTSSSALLNTDVTTALGFTPLQHNETITTSGDVSGSGTNSISLTLANTGVIAGNYSLASITVDSKGRITSVTNGTVSGSGTVTSIAVSGDSAISVSGSPVTTSGTIALSLSNTSVAAGQYTLASITVDSQGRITAASNGSVSGASGGTVTSVAVSGDSAISVSGSPITGSGTIALKLSNTGVSAGTYSKIVVDAQGRVTSSAALSSSDITTALGFTPGQGTVTSVSANSTTLSISGSPVTSSGTLSVNLSTVGTEGTYIKVVTDSYGRVTSSSTLSNADITTALGYTPLQNAVTSINANSTTLSISGGPVTSSGILSINLNTLGSVGTYTKVVTDAYGRVSSGSALSSIDVTTALGFTPGTGNGSVTSINANSTTLSISGGPVTTSGTLSINLNTVGSAGTYAKVVTDSYGRVSSGSALSSLDVTTALGFTPLQNNQTITLSGDITGSGASSIAASLSNTGVLAGTYTVSTIVVDSKGRITSANSGVASGTGTVTSVSTANSTNILTSGTNSITSTGTFAFDLSDTGVTPGTYNYSTIVVDAKGRISNASTNSSSGGATFGVNKTNSAVVAAATTLNFTGNGVTVTDQGSGVAKVSIQDRVEYAYFQYGSGGSGQFTNGDNLISNSANMAVSIVDGTNCTVKFTFTGYTNPPIGIAVYGQSYSTNQFTYNAVNGSYAGGAVRVITGGGTASSPTFMNTFTDITLQMKMADTGASAGIGQRAHAYIVFKF